MKRRTLRNLGIGVGVLIALYVVYIIGVRAYRQHWESTPGPVLTMADTPPIVTGELAPALLPLIREWTRCYGEYAFNKEEFVTTLLSVMPPTNQDQAYAESLYEKHREWPAKLVSFNEMRITARENSARVTYSVTFRSIFGQEFQFTLVSDWQKENGQWHLFVWEPQDASG